jgi:protein required for attachment to host cells
VLRKTWIVVGDASRARIFLGSEASDSWSLVEDLDFPPGRERIHDLVTDHPGSTKQSGAKGTKVGMTPPTDPKEKEAIRFARTLAGRLKKGRTGKEYDALVLVAPPHFLGMLRGELDRDTAHLVVKSQHHDYTQFRPDQLEKMVEWRS